jgi:hypothetical protein
MAYIDLSLDETRHPGITGLLAYRPETAPPTRGVRRRTARRAQFVVPGRARTDRRVRLDAQRLHLLPQLALRVRRGARHRAHRRSILHDQPIRRRTRHACPPTNPAGTKPPSLPSSPTATPPVARATDSSPHRTDRARPRLLRDPQAQTSGTRTAHPRPAQTRTSRAVRDRVAHAHRVRRGSAWPARHCQPRSVLIQNWVIGMR